MNPCLHSQLTKYPKMQPVDLVKLLFQREFVGGHMAMDAAQNLARIETECAGLPPFSGDAFEDIGGGLCRLHLGTLRSIDLTPAAVNRLFMATSAAVTGSLARFEALLNELLDSCRKGELPFDYAELEKYISGYCAQGCPPVSHSADYSKAYAPAYRVVKSAYVRIIGVFRRIDALMDTGKTVTVAIDGSSGAGKSSLAALLAEVYDCNVFHMDHFFLPQARKTEARLSEAGGNVDYERFGREVIEGLKGGGAFSYHIFDCAAQSLDTVQVTPKKLNIIEGVYSLHPSLGDPYDLKIFLETGGSEQRSRILLRNGADMLARFETEWIPLENRYFDALQIRTRCDLVFGAQLVLDETRASCL